MKLSTLPFAGLFVALTLWSCLPLRASGQTTGRKNPELVIGSMVGRDLFGFYCASCHGRDGKGGGHAAAALKVPPPDLTTLAKRNGGRFSAARLEAIVTGKETLATPAHGSSEMPVWGPIFKGLDNRDAINAARIESIVGYIESIQAKEKALHSRERPGQCRPKHSVHG